jgi:hypothetical protein
MLYVRACTVYMNLDDAGTEPAARHTYPSGCEGCIVQYCIRFPAKRRRYGRYLRFRVKNRLGVMMTGRRLFDDLTLKRRCVPSQPYKQSAHCGKGFLGRPLSLLRLGKGPYCVDD